MGLTEKFARDVVDRKIIAGPHVRAACRRHLKDLKTAYLRGFVFDAAKEERALHFFPLVLRLNGGESEGVPFALDGWQAFCIGSLFGWVKAGAGTRRFDKFYVETGKGSGKSPLVAGIGVYMLVGCNEPRAQCYSAAGNKDQAKILFNDAVAMVKQSPALSSRMDFSGGPGREWNMMFEPTLGFFRPLASDTAQSGLRPYYAVCDELHEHKDASTLNLLTAGKKNHKEAIVGSITNSGFDKSTICGQQHDYAVDIAHGNKEDDSFFSFVCSLDEGDDPMIDESCWAKANPSLQNINLPGVDYLRGEVRQAKGMPGKQSSVLRLNFCRWTEAETVFVSRDNWEACQKEYTLDDFAGATCYGGLDLSTIHDLTALTLTFERDESLFTFPFFWLPEQNLHQLEAKAQQPLQVWADQKYLELIPGPVIDKAFVAARIVEITAGFDLREIAYDRHRIGDLLPFLQQAGCDLPLTPHGQGYFTNKIKEDETIEFGMSTAIDALEQAIIKRTFVHNNSPVMNWCARNTVITQDPAGNRKFDKARAVNRIDGMVSAAMSVNLATARGMAGVKTEDYFSWL